MRITRNIFLFGLILISGHLCAQLSGEYSTYKSLYPNSDQVRLTAQNNMNIELVKDKIAISITNFEENLYLNANANHYSEESVSYSTFVELKKIEASSFVFIDDKYRQIKVKDFKHKDDLSGNAFYDDSRTVNFIYSNLQEGAKSRLFYEESINDPHFLRSFYFGSVFPVINTTFTITADKGITLEFKEFNMDSLDVIFSTDEKSGKMIYKWMARNVAKYEPENNSIDPRYSIPHVIPMITSYKVNGDKVVLLKNAGSLYSWYYSLIKDLNTQPGDAKLIEVVNSLTADKETEIEKVRAIYYWVQTNIKYVAYEYALGGFVPREANEVFSKKYGDCKDNSSILQEMFKLANIKGNIAWIGTRQLPYSYLEVPTPASANHMIFIYLNDSTTYYLDATSRYQPLELPSWVIQGKEALISIDSNQYQIKKVPVIEAEKSFYLDTVQLSIHELDLVGKGKVSIGGYLKISFYNLLEKQKNRDDLKRFYNFNFQKGNNKFLINQFHEINKYDYDKDFIVDYTFQIDNYVLKSGNELYVNLNLTKDVVDFKIKKEDKLDKEYNYKMYTGFTYKLDIPVGYHVSYIPRDVVLENEQFSAHIKYTQNGTQIVYQHDIGLNFLVLKKESFVRFNQFIDQLDKAYKESIVLTKDTN